MKDQIDFTAVPMKKQDLHPDPVEQFSAWYLAAQTQGEFDPSAMTLATVNKNYDVTARMVLLKGFDQRGFSFFTNYQSPKALALKEIPNAALVFWWPLCQRQVRITGKVKLLDSVSSDKYFNTRSVDSRIAAIISQQSAVIPSREDLLQRYDAASQQYQSQSTIARPDFWGGYLLEHQSIEFWQGRLHRLHDRFIYRKQDQKWDIQQLSP